MKNTRFTWKTLISGKNHGNRKFHYEQLRNTIRTIKPDLVWECAETTISADRIQTLAHRRLFLLSFPSFSVFHSLFLFWFSLLFFSLSFWVRILLHSHYCVENSVVLRVTHTYNSFFPSYIYTARPVGIYILGRFYFICKKAYVYVYVSIWLSTNSAFSPNSVNWPPIRFFGKPTILLLSDRLRPNSVIRLFSAFRLFSVIRHISASQPISTSRLLSRLFGRLPRKEGHIYTTGWNEEVDGGQRVEEYKGNQLPPNWRLVIPKSDQDSGEKWSKRRKTERAIAEAMKVKGSRRSAPPTLKHPLI